MARIIKLVDGIPTAFTGSAKQQCEEFTLSAGDITNKYVDLSAIPLEPSCVQVDVIGIGQQRYSVDWNIITDGSELKRLSWDSAEATISSGMESDLQAGDVLVVTYFE